MTSSAARVSRCVEYVQVALATQADPSKAGDMAAYMKTEMPFYGVQKPGRTTILRHIRQDFAPRGRDEYQELVLALWSLPHREEKYLAQAVAGAFQLYVVPESMPIYQLFITEGHWWDFVDEAATHLVRRLVLDHPAETWPVVDGWIEADDMWLRRAAIICQVGAKDRTDADRLFRFCARSAHEGDFFIRKGIGWALREYAKTDPVRVAEFVDRHRRELSRLSFKEATKHIGHLVPG